MILRTLTPVLSIIISVLLFVFFIKPTYEETSLKREELKQYSNAIEKYNEYSMIVQKKMSIKTTRSAYDNQRLERLVPGNLDDTQLLVDLKKIATTNQLLFGNTSVESEVVDLSTQSSTEVEVGSGDDLITSDITFDVIGTYDQFKNFIADLEKSMTLFEVISISLSASDSTFQQFTVGIRVYELPSI